MATSASILVHGPALALAIDNRHRCEALSSEITLLAGHINAAHHRFLTLIAEFDTRNGWNAEGCQSCAHWLNWKCGIDMGAAREKIRVAHALESLPKIAAAMESGRLSYSKVRALTRVATPEVEETLLTFALHGTAQHVETIVRHYRRCKDVEELGRERSQQESRSFSYRWDEDGSMIINARLPAEAGRLLLKALELAAKEVPLDEKEEARLEALKEMTPVAAAIKFSATTKQRADALSLLAESFMAHGSAALSGGDKHQIVVHVSAETLQRSEAGQCEFEDGPSVSAETSRRLSCDCSVVAIVENDKGEPLNVGRKTRSIPPALKRALNSRDQGCRFPGCCNKKYVDGHHIEHWAEGGETKLSNLVTLCRFHHRLVHEGGVTIQILDDGALRFIKPNGTSYDSIAPHHSRPLDWSELTRENEERGVSIDTRTAVTLFAGGPVDYGMAVEALLWKARRGKVASELSAERATG